MVLPQQRKHTGIWSTRLQYSTTLMRSATAEDLPTASFAGQQETYLNVSGYEDHQPDC